MYHLDAMLHAVLAISWGIIVGCNEIFPSFSALNVLYLQAR